MQMMLMLMLHAVLWIIQSFDSGVSYLLQHSRHSCRVKILGSEFLTPKQWRFLVLLTELHQPFSFEIQIPNVNHLYIPMYILMVPNTFITKLNIIPPLHFILHYLLILISGTIKNFSLNAINFSTSSILLSRCMW